MLATLRFVSCMDESCPLNETKQCRAPMIAIGTNGACLLRENGPFEGKSETEKYVEISECRCQKCNHWELDEVSNTGVCGLAENLTFLQHKNEPLNPQCQTFEKQISAPEYTSKF